MNFETPAQKAIFEKVGTWMKELFGEQAMARQDAPAYGIVVGSSLTQVFVIPWGDDDATIETMSYVVTGPELSPELLRFLLEKNFNMRFGAFSLDGDGDIVFSYGIVGSTSDKEELKASIFAVAKTADEFDDQIVSRFGGKRAIDMMKGN
ncbi:MAG: YbjN domain-containing protein [Candidatus Hadarchaeum sp.]